MSLRPSNVRFTQNSINNVFGRNTDHSNKPIGETLDDLLTGRLQISDIPEIRVVRKGRVWYTRDSRRLWVFQKLEEYGGCTHIPVERVNEDLPRGRKLTRITRRRVRVRGDVGGQYWKTLYPVSAVGTPSRPVQPRPQQRRRSLQQQIADDMEDDEDIEDTEDDEDIEDMDNQE